jgi:hypothetical protein
LMATSTSDILITPTRGVLHERCSL